MSIDKTHYTEKLDNTEIVVLREQSFVRTSVNVISYMYLLQYKLNYVVLFGISLFGS